MIELWRRTQKPRTLLLDFSRRRRIRLRCETVNNKERDEAKVAANGKGTRRTYGFVVRAIGYGGLNFEDDTAESLSEAMAILDAGLTRWFKDQGVEGR
jgi:hypothetical protein